jgi:hypothetical protein
MRLPGTEQGPRPPAWKQRTLSAEGTQLAATAAAPVKECPKCHVLILADCARCPDCGFRFVGCAPRDDTASHAAALSSQVKQVLGTRRRPSAIAGGPIRTGRHPLRTPPASAMPGFIIGVLWGIPSKSMFNLRKVV